MDEKVTTIPFDSGNATVEPKDGAKFKITVSTNGIKYEFEASPAGIESFSIDGGKINNYSKEEK